MMLVAVSDGDGRDWKKKQRIEENIHKQSPLNLISSESLRFLADWISTWHAVHSHEAKRATKDFAAPRLSAVHTMTEEFENGGFTLKTHQMFYVHTTPEERKNATVTGHFWFVFEKRTDRIIVWLSWGHCFQTAGSVFKMFFVQTKTKRRRFQIPLVWRAFSKRSVFVTD